MAANLATVLATGTRMEWLFRHRYTNYELGFAAPRAPGDSEEQAGEDRLVSELCRAMPSLKLREYLDYKRSLLRDSDYLVVAFARSTGEAVAMFAVDWHTRDDIEFMHLGTMLIGEAYQGTLLLMHMLGFMFGNVHELDGKLPALVSMKTYNARSYSFMNLFTRLRPLGVAFYPLVSGEQASAELKDTAARIAEILSPGLDFCRDTGVIQGGAGDVPADFWPAFPRARDQRINAYFHQHMTPRDRLLCLLSIPGDTAWQQIMKFLHVKTNAARPPRSAPP